MLKAVKMWWMEIPWNGKYVSLESETVRKSPICWLDNQQASALPPMKTDIPAKRLIDIEKKNTGLN